MAKNIDYIIIATMYYVEIFEKLVRNDVPKDKIILTDAIDELPYTNNFNVIKEISIKLYKKMIIWSSKCMMGM